MIYGVGGQAFMKMMIIITREMKIKTGITDLTSTLFLTMSRGETMPITRYMQIRVIEMRE